MLKGIYGCAMGLGPFANLRGTGRNKLRDFWSWTKEKKKEEKKINVVKPRTIDCTERNRQNFDPECKVAIVLGGATDTGLSAADTLLYHGARVVILADEDPRKGQNAARSLCDFYGKNRARFLRCDPRSLCQLENVFEETICRYKSVDVVFNNLDRKRSELRRRVENSSKIDDCQLSNTARAITVAVKYLGQRENKNKSGIIVNSASIIGFMGWPEDPLPIYCFEKEPVAETTIDLAKKYPMDETGVRIVAILKSQRPFAEIALPDFPTSNSRVRTDDILSAHCEPTLESRIGRALTHAMSRAESGTVWLSEPSPCTREIPWQIHFPARQGENVDPRIYERQIQVKNVCYIHDTDMHSP